MTAINVQQIEWVVLFSSSGGESASAVALHEEGGRWPGLLQLMLQMRDLCLVSTSCFTFFLHQRSRERDVIPFFAARKKMESATGVAVEPLNAHPRPRFVFPEIISVPRYLHGQNGVVVFVSYTQSRPRLGLVVRSRGTTRLHIRGLCPWAAGEPTRRQATEPPSRRTTERASTSKMSPPSPHRSQ